MQDLIIDPMKGESFTAAIIVSKFNLNITNQLKQGAVKRLEEYGIKQSDLIIVEVPGAIEIPIIAQQIAKHGLAAVIIALGAVIRGETNHYDYVCAQVSEGCQRVALDYNIPVIFGVLTTENESQAWERLNGKHGHKGREAADTAVMMHNIMGQIERIAK